MKKFAKFLKFVVRRHNEVVAGLKKVGNENFWALLKEVNYYLPDDITSLDWKDLVDVLREYGKSARRKPRDRN